MIKKTLECELKFINEDEDCPYIRHNNFALFQFIILLMLNICNALNIKIMIHANQVNENTISKRYLTA